jgi:hypothetical protein
VDTSARPGRISGRLPKGLAPIQVALLPSLFIIQYAVYWGLLIRDGQIGWLAIFSFHTLVAMVLSCMFATGHCNPGHIPREVPWTNGAFILTDEERTLRKQIQDDPSFISSALPQSQRDAIRRLPLVDTKRKEGAEYRWCKKCDAFKPDRTHHCHECDRCVLSMHSHLTWLVTCVGMHTLPYL